MICPDWIALSQLQCLTYTQKLTLLDHYDRPDQMLGLEQAQILSYGSKRPLRKYVDRQQLDEALNWRASRTDHHIISIKSVHYPPLLRQIPDPPLILYLIGDCTSLARDQMAIVGSRKCTRAGEQTAQRFAAELSMAGLVVTSGMAVGIDTAAHRGALEVAGKTIAVLGTSIEKCYPASNATLYRRIAEQGLLVSEFPLGTEPKRPNFPQRNRIISGLGLGVLVVESAQPSGSLITANLAAQQNREVFAIPGSINAPASSGCLALIQQGAKLTCSLGDILEEFSELSVRELNNTPKSPDRRAQTISSGNQMILTLLSDAPTSFDKLISISGLTIDQLCSILLDLELDGWIEKLPGNHYIRTAR